MLLLSYHRMQVSMEVLQRGATVSSHLQAHGGHLEEDSEASDDDDDQEDDDDDDDEDEDDDDEYATPHQGVVIEELEDGPAPVAVRKLARSCAVPGTAGEAAQLGHAPLRLHELQVCE